MQVSTVQGLDASQFLPRNTPVVNIEWVKRHSIKIPYAAGVYESPTAWVKIGPQGEITHASEKDATIINYLVGAGYIDTCHMEASLSFMELRHAYQSKSGFKSNSVYLAKFGDGTISKADVERAYEYICNELENKSVKLVVYACNEVCDEKSGCQKAQVCNIYRLIMERLLEASDKIWRIIKAEEENLVA